jgi:hypothetical protein
LYIKIQLTISHKAPVHVLLGPSLTLPLPLSYNINDDSCPFYKNKNAFNNFFKFQEKMRIAFQKMAFAGNWDT